MTTAVTLNTEQPIVWIFFDPFLPPVTVCEDVPLLVTEKARGRGRLVLVLQDPFRLRRRVTRVAAAVISTTTAVVIAPSLWGLAPVCR